MAIISNSFTPGIVGLDGNKESKQAAAGGFDALLSASNQNNVLVDEFIETIKSTVQGFLAGDTRYPFSSAFESAFGTGGPLPAFINKITAKLGLTAEQNQAFQDIAIRNKDIVKTPESMKKLSEELKLAGIQYK